MFASCFFPFSLKFPSYYYHSNTFNKRLDYDDKKYLMNPTNFKTDELSRGVYLPFVTKFFKKKLGDNLFKSSEYRDENRKLKIPFDFNYEITDSQLTFLQENTDLSYIILTKTLSLEQAKNESLNKVDNNRFYLANFGAISFIKIIDLKTKGALLEMSCSATVIVREDLFAESQTEYDAMPPLQPVALYKNAKSLEKKSMKKLLKKIK